MKIRTFIAVKIEEDALNKIVVARNTLFDKENFKFEPKDKLHITLKFIGDIEEGVIPILQSELKKIAGNNKGFTLKFSKFGFFKRDGKPSIFWAGIQQEEKLSKLYLDIEKSLSVIGFKNEKRNFKPHLTLIRFRKYDRVGDLTKILNEDISEIKFNVGGFSLFKSELKPTGSEYYEISEFKFIK